MEHPARTLLKKKGSPFAQHVNLTLKAISIAGASVAGLWPVKPYSGPFDRLSMARSRQLKLKPTKLSQQLM